MAADGRDENGRSQIKDNSIFTARAIVRVSAFSCTGFLSPSPQGNMKTLDITCAYNELRYNRGNKS